MVTVEWVVPGEVLKGLGVSGSATVVVTNGADVMATIDRLRIRTSGSASLRTKRRDR